MRILLVEDDRSIAESVVEGLLANAFVVTHVSTGGEALAAADHDLILLDLGLPDMDGRDVCRQLRKRTKAPIIMLTARAEEFDRILGLEMGADDYVTKPFSFRELVARIRAVARRTLDTGQPVEEANATITIGPMRIDRRSRRLGRRGVGRGGFGNRRGRGRLVGDRRRKLDDGTGKAGRKQRNRGHSRCRLHVRTIRVFAGVCLTCLKREAV